MLLLSLASVYFIYSPGLSGGFWLDDHGSLPDLFESVNAGGYWEGVFGGGTGPLGRPLSLLSFAWQHESWPKPFAFLLFNIVLHIMNAFLVFLLCYKLLASVLEYDEVDAKYQYRFTVALTITMFWALSPLLVSTVLYVIQRMVLLSSFFVLLACLCFCWGCQLLRAQKVRCAIAVFIAGCGGCGLLGMLAKESAFLLVIYLFAIKYILDQSGVSKNWFYRIVIPWLLWLACLLFLIYTLFKLQGTFASTYQWREFGLSERLLTEARIVWLYVGQLFLPEVSYLGLYHDDFQISRSIFNPVTTFWSLLAWLLVAGIFFWALRKREKIVVFGLLWFIGGHLMESTVIPLELYFEHRNYLPAIGLWFAVIVYVKKLWHVINATLIKKVLVVGLLVYGVFFGGITYYLTSLWGRPAELSVVYAAERKQSLRARALMIALYQKAGSVDKAYGSLNEIIIDFPTELAPKLIRVQLACVHPGNYSDGLTGDVFEFATRARFSHGSLMALAGLIDGEMWEGKCQYYSSGDLILLINALRANPNYRHKIPMLAGFTSQIYRQEGDFEMAIEWLRRSSSTGYDRDLLEVVMLASINRHKESLALLQEIKTHRLPSYISKSRRSYLRELEITIKNDIESQD